jgi:ribonucleotide reductase alpha subunit
MVMDLKHFDGSLGPIDRVPAEVKQLYATAFEVETQWLVEAAARRQKWIDQAQSLNIYMAGASGKKLDETYKLAWLRGLKTTYYLRTMSATHAEKSTVDGRQDERGVLRQRRQGFHTCQRVLWRLRRPRRCCKWRWPPTLLPTSGSAVWTTRLASPASDVEKVRIELQVDAIEQHKAAVKCMITFHFNSLLP